MGAERPYSGQLWRRDSRPVMIVPVSPRTVTYDDLSRDERATESVEGFVGAFRRMKR